jgi:hypothetical protein
MYFLKRIICLSAYTLSVSLSAQIVNPEQYLEASRPAGPLKGTLLTSGVKSAPVVLMIPGSGPTDLDGNNPSALEQGQRVGTANMHPALQGLFNPSVQGFLISAFSYDPRRLLAGYSKPVLVLQRLRDIQVKEVDACLLKEANPQANLVLLPHTNHVLKSVSPDDIRANISTYADSGLPLAPGVVDAIGTFLADKAEATRK